MRASEGVFANVGDRWLSNQVRAGNKESMGEAIGYGNLLGTYHGSVLAFRLLLDIQEKSSTAF